MKTCSKCGAEKPVAAFSRDRSKPDGRYPRCKACNAATKERRAAYGQAWRLLHPERVNALNAKRHAAKRQRTPPWLTAEHPAEIEAHYALAKEAEQIAGEPHHVDHIVPLQGRKVSGLHVPWNMQILPASSNIRKSNKWPT